MANDFQASVLKAVDILIENRVNQLATDKTVTATIVTCTNSLTGEYKISYNGGMTWAYAQNGASYTPNTTVYVLVPEGDFSKKKLIVDKATLSGDDSNISFISSALSDYNLIGRNVITDKKKILPAGLHSYLAQDYLLLYQRGQSGNYLNVNVSEFDNYIKEAQSIMIEASFKTRLPKTHRMSKTGIYGLQFAIAVKDGDATDDKGNPKIKYVSYVLDMNNMTGNPYLFNTWADQYAIFPIDPKTFLYIDSIMAYSKGFVTKDDKTNAEMYGADIFVDQIEIYGLKKISGINGDYRLSVSMPHGGTFKSIQSSESLDIIARTTYRIDQDLSDSTTYYWFVEDGRITASSADYQMYGGAGWRRLKSKGVNYTINILGSENRAYENKYLCVAVYKESVILKEYFTIYNDAAKRDISINSDLGVKFSFDRGTPTLTCLIDGKVSGFETGKAQPHKDSLFRFIWSKTDQYGQTTTFNQTKAQLQKQYDDGIKSGMSYSELTSLKNQIAALEGVTFTLGKNVLKYPVKQIDSVATFKCSVYLRDSDGGEEYAIGSASITLQNESAAEPSDYYIIIENGEQVFQYSESGVSPNSDRYQDPLKILPLTCHLYDPAGLEVNKKTYNVKWLVPLTDTLIVAPKQGMQLNPSTGKIEWYVGESYPTTIAANYDYQALDNQITCIVKYQGIEYTKDTRFFFGKVGDNGTNGTDMVAKISPTSEIAMLDKEMLTLELIDGKPKQWNTKQALTAKVLDFDLYQRNELVTTTSVSWTMADKRTTYMSVKNGVVSWNSNAQAKVRSQIVRASTRVEGQDYYAFYTIPVVDYKNSNINTYHISIDKDRTLKQILYNADGHNPLYNKNQGVKINIKQNGRSASGKFIVWSAEGGVNGTNPAFKLMKQKNLAKSATAKLIPAETGDTWEDLSQIYILPEDVYDGMYTNNLVHGKIYTNRTIYLNNGNPEAELWVPIHMSLNTFGLASLNAWDGNHIEINEDGNYIIAPQIGAGSKDTNNRFTGVVMGTAETYDSKDPAIGLLGYSHGKQSIWLDSETGNAIFGLPENQASTNNKFTEGRIELRPGATSKIGMWNIGSRAIYNMTVPSSSNYSGVNPDGAYKDYPVSGAQMSVPPSAQGVILNANPAYLSVKGMPLNEKNSNIQWNGANTVLEKGDSLEVELDPGKSSVFSIYRHTKDNSGDWYRYPLVGINANGQFYTNAIEDGESSMGIGKIGAFGLSAAKERYVGAQFGWRGTNLFKFFVDQTEKDANGKEKSDASKALHISAGTTTSNEYPRAFKIYGSEIWMYAPDSDKLTQISSTHSIGISPTFARIGHANSYIKIETDAEKGIDIITDQNLDLRTGTTKTASLVTGNKTEVIHSSRTSNITENNVEIIGGNSMLSIGKTFTTTAGIDYTLTSKYFDLKMLQTGTSGSPQARLGALDNSVYMQMNRTVPSWLRADAGWNLRSETGGINITSSNSSSGVIIQATPPNGKAAQGVRLSMIPQDGGSASNFTVTTPHGSIASKNDLGDGLKGYQIAPGLSTNRIRVVKDGNGNYGTIYSAGNINSLSTISGASLKWNEAGIKNNIHNGYHSKNNYSSTSVWEHISALYDLISMLNQRLDSHVDDRSNPHGVTAYQAGARPNNWLPTPGEIGAQPAGDYVTQSTWNAQIGSVNVKDLRVNFVNHTHRTTSQYVNVATNWDTYNTVVGDVSHITGSKNTWDLYTGNPSY